MRKGFRFPVNLSFLLMFVFLTSCADEADEGRKLCKRFGPLCQEAEEGKEGEEPKTLKTSLEGTTSGVGNGE